MKMICVDPGRFNLRANKEYVVAELRPGSDFVRVIDEQGVVQTVYSSRFRASQRVWLKCRPNQAGSNFTEGKLYLAEPNGTSEFPWRILENDRGRDQIVDLIRFEIVDGPAAEEKPAEKKGPYAGLDPNAGMIERDRKALQATKVQAQVKRPLCPVHVAFNPTNNLLKGGEKLMEPVGLREVE